jgi:hypothetical protein
MQETGIDNVFFLEKSCRKMYAILSAVQRQQRKSDVMTSFGLTACSAVYYQVSHCRILIILVLPCLFSIQSTETGHPGHPGVAQSPVG